MHGLVLKEVEQDNQYIFGNRTLPRILLQEDGQWHKYLPVYEPQYNANFDTSACTIFGTVNAVEILEKRVFGTSPNYSERFHYNLIPIRPPGGDPHDAAESIRNRGMIEQDALPMTPTFGEYILPEPTPKNLLDLGKKWLETHDFGHEYLWRIEPSIAKRNAILKEALRYSPIGVSVTAWNLADDGTYEDRGDSNNHWCVLIGYEEKNDKFYPIIFDSYDHEVKKLSSDHHIKVAKRYHLNKIDLGNQVYNEPKPIGIWAFIRDLIRKIFR